jgi:predicted HAD superfamily phosphohydrolase YqeG|tara:strand:+ start:317 stop:622 length:306 start_codon:yes stop_codon:yes gene_type:complete
MNIKQIAIDHLKQHIKEGDTLFTNVTHVSRSGMSRNINVYSLRKDDCSKWNYYISRALDYTLKKDNTISIKGCGMDMGFHLVYCLSKALYDDGYAIKQRWL